MADITWHQQYPGGRIVARLGKIDVGAVFPDPGAGNARWMFWLDRMSDTVLARTEGAAKAALAARIADWLDRARLVSKEAQP